ncbi:hypothetical protein [Bradyrhizobium canariense]|uniref:Uncharacterized protein n=1 Tax=Bradyrhizobium canariense TaxID=255045 RepID=A0A1H2BFK7_9BRAD|nr:hypothetical protein [Bradyrhizobium canariense]SDT56689.1 hypothetical protein SAMN05444158_7098 [Bradyrhizobium canariense]
MDPELAVARLILELLARSRLSKDDPLLRQAIELAREPLSVLPRDSIRAELSSAIETLQNVIQDGADVDLIEQWHAYAMSLAERFIASRS